VTPPALERPRFEAHGASADLILSTEREVLYEGPANTGKSRTVLEKCRMLMEDPEIRGLRMLWVRKTRKSLTQSVLVTWEQHVIPHDHPCKVGTAQRENRDRYYYEPTECEIVLGGMDNPDRVMSTEYDIIVYFEATEGQLDEWEKLLTRSRNKRFQIGQFSDGRPRFFRQLIADCNPGARNHWLNQRALGGKMRRIKARHSDNPIFDEDDQAALDALTGARRARLRDGLWVSSEGQIWEAWDERKHMAWRRDFLWDPKDPSQGYRFEWYFGSLDFGTRHAGVLQVWGCIENRMVRVAEVHRREMGIEWWAGAIERQLDRWNMERIVADGGGQGIALIDYLNDRLGPLGGREEDPLVIATEKGPGSRLAGFNLVGDLLREDRILLCHDAMEDGPCPVSLGDLQPTCTEQEIPDFTWKLAKDGQPTKEESEPGPDDGCFAMIYAARWRWGRDLSDKRGVGYVPGSMGDVLDHKQAWEEFDEDTEDEALLPVSDFDEWGNLI